MRYVLHTQGSHLTMYSNARDILNGAACSGVIVVLPDVHWAKWSQNVTTLGKALHSSNNSL